MLTTHCTNADCPEVNVAKEVPDDLAGEAITCGACGQPTTPPADTGTNPGEPVA